MTYTVELSEIAQDQVQALPSPVLLPFAEVLTVLELTPWNSRPFNPSHPGGAVRVLPFGGDGLVIYLILDDQQIVDVLDVQWIDISADDG